MSKSIGFKARNGDIRVYTWTGVHIETSDGEVITQSANEFRKVTAKGNNLKTTQLTKNNWESAARIHADKFGGFFKMAQPFEVEQVLKGQKPEVDNTPRFKIVQDWIEAERGCFE